MKPLIVLPTYNNRATLRQVAEAALAQPWSVLVVDDGSTDGALDALEGLPLETLRLPENRGKGAAILAAANWAEPRGFTHVITIDTDGQHDPADIPRFVEAMEKAPMHLFVGERDFEQTGIPGGSRFGRVWSNMWLRIASGQSVRDSQCGFRGYPLCVLRRLPFSSRRYDFEIEVLVKASWAGITLDSLPVSVYYPPASERVSHFDQLRDNARISRVYTKAVIRHFLPKRYGIQFDTERARNRIAWKHPWRALKQLLRERTTPHEVAAACFVGVVVGALPIFGFHTPLILFLATGLRLNRVIAYNAQHLCMPPVVPVLCIEIGYFLRNGEWLVEVSRQTLWNEAPLRLWEWLLGSLILGPALGALSAGVAWVASHLAIRAIRRNRSRRGASPPR